MSPPRLDARSVATLLACLCAVGCAAKRFGPTELNYHPRQVLVRWTDEALDEQQPQGERETALISVGGTVKRKYSLVPGLELVQVDPWVPIEDAVRNLDKSRATVYAEHDYYVHAFGEPDDTHFPLQWNMYNRGQVVGPHPGVVGADIGAEPGWDLFTGDEDFVIAVIDTGIELTHPDLARNAWTNPDESAGGGDDDGNGLVDDLRGWDFFSGDSEPYDPEGHGTHVAGIIGARGNNGVGVAGVNWECKLMALRFMGSGRGTTSDAIVALQYAVDKRVRVSCNSWGDDDETQSLKEAIEAAGARGHLFVTAAGNRATDIDGTPLYPASYKLENIIAVASTDNRDELGTKSNWGVETVHLGAPGVYVLSTSNDSTYQVHSGTSVAAAHVAGVVAMVMAANPDLSSMEVRDRVFATARPVSALETKTMFPAVVSLVGALTGPP